MTASTCQTATARSESVDSQRDLTLDEEISFIGTDEFADFEYTDEERQWVRELTSGAVPVASATQTDSLLGPLVARSAPLLTRAQERILFRRMNYAKFQAEAIRSALSQPRPSQRKVDRLRALMQEASAIRRRIAESNLRLVVSITRKYARPAQQFQDFLSDGLLILLGAIEKFDYSRGFRFSTYATHAIQRHYFRLSQRNQRHTQLFVVTPGDVLAELVSAEEPDDGPEHDWVRLYRQLMETGRERLNERETSVLQRRFGTDGRGVTQTLREVAADLGISKERVRQIQIAALAKLREAAAELNLTATAG